MNSIIISEGVERIESNAFRLCISLKRLEFPGSLKEIGENAFKDCSGLEEVVFSEGIHIISESAFYGCNKLRKVVIPASVNEIGRWAFQNHGKLEIWGYSGTYAEKYAQSFPVPIFFHDMNAMDKKEFFEDATFE